MSVANIEEVIKNYPEITGVHPACTAVPPISEEDYASLLKDMKPGFDRRQSIALTPEGLLLDGRNRLTACNELGVAPIFDVVSQDPWEYSHKMNISRRHLGVGQRACFGATRLEYEKELAKERKIATQNNDSAKTRQGKFSQSDGDGRARDKAGEKVGVSGKSIDQAKKLQDESPDLFEKVKAGEISLNAAMKQAFPKPATVAVPTETHEPTEVPFDSPGDDSPISSPADAGVEYEDDTDEPEPKKNAVSPQGHPAAEVKLSKKLCPLCGFNLPVDRVAKLCVNKRVPQTDKERREEYRDYAVKDLRNAMFRVNELWIEIKSNQPSRKETIEKFMKVERMIADVQHALEDIPC